MTGLRPPSDPSPARFRFTIGRGMFAVAVAAGLSAMARVAPYLVLYLVFLAASGGAGWMAWRACRRRPAIAPRLALATIAVGIVLTAIGVRVALIDSAGWFLAWTVLVAPIHVGATLAWIRWIAGDQQHGGLRRGDIETDMLMVATAGLSLLLAIPVHIWMVLLAVSTRFRD